MIYAILIGAILFFIFKASSQNTKISEVQKRDSLNNRYKEVIAVVFYGYENLSIIKASENVLELLAHNSKLGWQRLRFDESISYMTIKITNDEETIFIWDFKKDEESKIIIEKIGAALLRTTENNIPKIINDFKVIINHFSENYTNIAIVGYDEYYVALEGDNMKVLLCTNPMSIKFEHITEGGKGELTLVASTTSELLKNFKNYVGKIQYYSTDLKEANKNLQSLISLLSNFNSSIGEIIKNSERSYFITYEDTYNGREFLQLSNSLKSLHVRWDLRFHEDGQKFNLDWEFPHVFIPTDVVRKILYDIEDLLYPPTDYSIAHNF